MKTKLKTHKGLKKRVKVTKSGKIKRRRAFLRHILGKKSSKRRRRLGKPTIVENKGEEKKLLRLLGEG